MSLFVWLEQVLQWQLTKKQYRRLLGQEFVGLLLTYGKVSNCSFDMPYQIEDSNYLHTGLQ